MKEIKVNINYTYSYGLFLLFIKMGDSVKNGIFSSSSSFLNISFVNVYAAHKRKNVEKKYLDNNTIVFK